MKRIILKSIGLFAASVLSAFSSAATAANFAQGNLVVADSSTIYLLDPASGNSDRIATGMTGLKDVVYNPVSDSVFAAVGSNIVQIKAAAFGYVSTPFILGVPDLQCLAVDAFGNVLFNQSDFVQHRFWRADLNAAASPITEPSFFVPRHMTFGKDYSKLYVFESPNNDVRVVSFPSGEISTFASGLDFPPGGDADAEGNVYVLEDFSTAKISRITPDGARTTFASQSWMNFTIFDDLVYDDETRTIYATSTSGLYALMPDLTNRKLLEGSGFFAGLSLIRPGLPLITQQPKSVVVSRGDTTTFSVGLENGGAATYQWRHDGANIPGAVGKSITLANVGSADAGSYSVFVVTAGGAAVSAEAALTLLDFAISPVVTLSGPVGAQYQIEYTDDVQASNNWRVLTNVTAISTFLDVVDHTASRSLRRFYRILPMP